MPLLFYFAVMTVLSTAIDEAAYWNLKSGMTLLEIKKTMVIPPGDYRTCADPLDVLWDLNRRFDAREGEDLLSWIGPICRIEVILSTDGRLKGKFFGRKITGARAEHATDCNALDGGGPSTVIGSRKADYRQDAK
jgi:hypothetical protein